MDNENTIPSQLGPVNTVPAPLGSMSGRLDPMPAADAGMGFGLKLFLVALATGLLVYLIR
jgi:hypothetical protein